MVGVFEGLKCIGGVKEHFKIRSKHEYDDVRGDIKDIITQPYETP